MNELNAIGESGLGSILSKLQGIKIREIENDEVVKNETLALARKLTATLEGPVNRATDLVFRVRQQTSSALHVAD